MNLGTIRISTGEERENSLSPSHSRSGRFQGTKGSGTMGTMEPLDRFQPVIESTSCLNTFKFVLCEHGINFL